MGIGEDILRTIGTYEGRGSPRPKTAEDIAPSELGGVFPDDPRWREVMEYEEYNRGQEAISGKAGHSSRFTRFSTGEL